MLKEACSKNNINTYESNEWSTFNLKHKQQTKQNMDLKNSCSHDYWTRTEKLPSGHDNQSHDYGHQYYTWSLGQVQLLMLDILHCIHWFALNVLYFNLFVQQAEIIVYF